MCARLAQAKLGSDVVGSIVVGIGNEVADGWCVEIVEMTSQWQYIGY